VNDKIKAILDGIKSVLLTVWNNGKVVIGVLLSILAIVKFKDVLASILVSGGKKAVTEADKKDETLSKEESDAKAQAEALVAKAKAESNQNPVGEDWNK
jgi:hypothetical protein